MRVYPKFREIISVVIIFILVLLEVLYLLFLNWESQGIDSLFELFIVLSLINIVLILVYNNTYFNIIDIRQNYILSRTIFKSSKILFAEIHEIGEVLLLWNKQNKPNRIQNLKIILSDFSQVELRLIGFSLDKSQLIVSDIIKKFDSNNSI